MNKMNNKNKDFVTMTRNLVLMTLVGSLLLGCMIFTTQITKSDDQGRILTREILQEFQQDDAVVYGWFHEGKLIEVELKGFKETKYKIK